jgi:hypothetical protein
MVSRCHDGMIAVIRSIGEPSGDSQHVDFDSAPICALLKEHASTARNLLGLVETKQQGETR